MAEQTWARRLLEVRHSDRLVRVRAVNALLLTYGMIVLAVLAAIPLALIPNGPLIASIVLLTTGIFVVSALLLRSGRVRAGLVVFYVGFLGAFAAVPILGQDARLSAVYCASAVMAAGVTLHRGGIAAVTVAALAIGVVGTLLYPPVDPPPGTFEIITAAVVLIFLSLVTSVLGLWGQRRETARADESARRATELAERLQTTNAELERRVEERTDALQRALSQQETLVAELADLSLRDPLTGLYNRRHVEHELPRLLAASERHDQPMAVALADLDHFKSVNDDYSYNAGDEVLLRFTELLRDTSRADDLLIRYGGEEFLVVMPQTSLEQAVVLCERLRARVEEHPWDEVVPGLRLTVSIGVADSSGRQNPAAVTAAADAAVHAAKRNGRNRVEQAPAVESAGTPR